jgi:Transposase DDE domain group 1
VFNQFGDLERCTLWSGNAHSAAGWRDVLEPVVVRYRGTVKRCYFRGDAAFANPEIYEFLAAEGAGYTIRLPANRVLQDKIGYLLKRPVGRPPHEVRRYYARFSYQAQSWRKARRVVAKVEWHPGELYPRVGFIVTNLARPAERVVAFYNQRSTAEQWIKEGKRAIKWTRLSCRSFAANAVRLQLHPFVRPGQFHADAGGAEDRGAVVADQPAQEAGIGAQSIGGFDRLGASGARFTVAREDQGDHPALTTTGNPGNVRLSACAINPRFTVGRALRVH